MVESYRFNLARIESSTESHKQALDQIQSAYNDANQILTEILCNVSWQGQQRDELEAFLTLLVSYHGDLVGENNHQSQGRDPYQKFVDGLEELQSNLNSYTTDSSSYGELKNL